MGQPALQGGGGTVQPLPQREGRLETVDMHINIGPQHPATHGVFRMVLQLSLIHI